LAIEYVDINEIIANEYFACTEIQLRMTDLKLFSVSRSEFEKKENEAQYTAQGTH